MSVIRALVANGEKILATAAEITSALSAELSHTIDVYLPKINDGSGATVAVDKVYHLTVTGAAPVQLLTLSGRRVGIVHNNIGQPRAQAWVIARAGTAQGAPDDLWEFDHHIYRGVFSDP